MIVISVCDYFWKYKFAVWYCGGGGGGAHYEVIVCWYAGYPWVNNTYPRFINFDKARSFLFSLDFSSSNSVYSVEEDSIISFKGGNCFYFVLRFTSNFIWNPPERIWSTNSLSRSVKYAEHSWIGHSRALSGSLLGNCKNISNIWSELLCMIIPFYISVIAWFMKSDNTHVECLINFLLCCVRHIISFAYAETHPTFTFLLISIKSWLLVWNLSEWLCLEQELLVCLQTLQWSLLDYPKFQSSKITNFNVITALKKTPIFEVPLGVMVGEFELIQQAQYCWFLFLQA